MGNSLRSSSRRAKLRQLCLALPIVIATGCSGAHTIGPQSFSQPMTAQVAWLGPTVPSDLAVLARWRAAVGSPLVRPSSVTARPADSLTIVSWNVALGAGDVIALVRRVRPAADAPIVLLLQEAFRSGDDIPKAPVDSMFAGFLGNSNASREVDAVAEALGLSLYYVPSMRNGAPGRHDEDRGNAILTNLPLDELSAIELPFERQRRVAVAGRIHGVTSAGRRWSLRLVSVHLDNTGSIKRAWVGGEYGRARQARGLGEALRGSDPIVVGGDFNTWFGFSDRAYAEIAKAFPQTRVTDTRRTFRGLLRLDHVFYQLPQGWAAEVRRAETALGSDHYPLITRLTF